MASIILGDIRGLAAIGRAGLAIGTGVFRIIGLALYPVWALVDGFIRLALIGIGVVMVLTFGFYALLQFSHPTHFPFATVAGMIFIWGLITGLYYRLADRIRGAARAR